MDNDSGKPRTVLNVASMYICRTWTQQSHSSYDWHSDWCLLPLSAFNLTYWRLYCA